MNHSMKAVSYRAYGGLDVLELGDRPMPRLSPGSVLIKVRAAAVNPVDWKIMAGGLDPIMDVHFPAVPGWDVAGVVEAVGFDTPEFSPGDEVYSYGRRDSVGEGTFAQYVVLPAGIVAHKPAELDWEHAAALPLAGLTAQRTLDALGLGAGDTLLVHNGSGGVGGFAIQLAAHAGVRVIATGSPASHDRLRRLGAEPVSYGPDLVAAVRVLAPHGVAGVADFIGGVLDQTLAVLDAEGRHASVADLTVVAHGGRNIWVRPDARELDRLSALVEQGKLSIEISASYPMERVADAFAASMAGKAAGKIVLTPFSA
ncbi:NADP-dependent oxidoreductase [Paeniglutamicibacter cryotolerans]|uniref:NADPH:quinone reductase-like Zn-dependent oxidoreductase n=1 Tax=Paeniglutamicibacter cryotolerans TaxID=670079 RepID=A0A839QH18_9MICC|nr:NADP-dependent oxidoreductase [Paeniglutamicibacter cryotolerans]MBB2995190.1 NADPH:quinone reductase-like Zn-dependent oxidoreductase [Paeniglutamicibacter cryotolerans]